MSPIVSSPLEIRWSNKYLGGGTPVTVSMVGFLTDVGWAFAAIATVGTAYALLAAILAGRFMQAPQNIAAHSPDVTILKPLHRCEPDLLRNLETFFEQKYPGAVQIVFGVHDENDPVVEVVRELQARYSHFDTAIVADAARYGANAKVSN